MINKQTVLILGAGASFPYGFPLGEKLFNMVIDDHSTDLPKRMSETGFNQVELGNFRSALRRSLFPSVDAFLEVNESFMDIGKAVMAYFLIRCEREDKLYTTANTQDWYRYLYNIMHSVELDEFANNKISFITYNYDRSLEYRLLNALKFGFPDVSSEKAASILDSIPIIHVHGELGKLKELDSNGREYHPVVSSQEIKIAMNGIGVVSEDKDNNPAYLRAHEVLKSAKNVIFLGFGYHPKNVERLQLDKNLSTEARVLGTIIGMTKDEVRYNVAHLFTNIKNFSAVDEYKTVLEYLRNNLDYFS